MSIRVRRIGPDRAGDVSLPDRPFRLWGRMVPALKNGVWSYETERLSVESEMCFPDCPYDVGEAGATFLGAYEEETDRCVGLAVLREEMFRYLCLDDLKVNRAYRGRGVGCMLIEACMGEAARQGRQGVYAVAQDNNLSACLFYLRCGFELGGFDNRSYRGTAQQEKANLFFYRDCPTE